MRKMVNVSLTLRMCNDNKNKKQFPKLIVLTILECCILFQGINIQYQKHCARIQRKLHELVNECPTFAM